MTKGWVSKLSLALPFMISGSSHAQELAPETRLLLEKMIAASDYNDSLLATGQAEYTVTRIDNLTDSKRSERVRFFLSRTGDARVDVDDGVRNPRQLLRGNRCYKFDNCEIDYVRRGEDPGKYSLFAYHGTRFTPLVHLRHAGLDLGPNQSIVTLADGLRMSIKASALIDVQDKGDNLFLSVAHPEGGSRRNLEVVPSQAFSVTKLTVIADIQPLPLYEAETKYRQLENGAFVASSGQQTKRIWKPDGSILVDHTLTFELTDVDLSPPDEARFTLADYRIPTGVQLRDKVTLKTYVYGVSPVSEESLELPTVFGSDTTRWWPWMGALLTMAGVGVGLVILRRFRRGRRGGAKG